MAYIGQENLEPDRDPDTGVPYPGTGGLILNSETMAPFEHRTHEIPDWQTASAHYRKPGLIPIVEDPYAEPLPAPAPAPEALPQAYAQDFSSLEPSIFGFLPNPPAGTSEADAYQWGRRFSRL